MKAGDYILEAELVEEGEGLCLLLEVEDCETSKTSITRWHGNATMRDLDVDLIRHSNLRVFTYNRESNVIYAVFDNGYQAISWRCENPSGDMSIID